MDKKYWVPALERANAVLDAIAKKHGVLKLSDLCEETGINKSSMFSLLRTMEELKWVRKNGNEAYELGESIAFLNSMYNEFSKKNTSLLEAFMVHSVQSVQEIGETFQLSVLNGHEIIYLAKQEGNSIVKLASKPGMKFPAHATAMGKMMLSAMDVLEIERLYPEKALTQITPHTITNWQAFLSELAVIREQGYALDGEEIIEGIYCIAAPIHDADGNVVAAISTSMLHHAYRVKQEKAVQELLKLAKQISQEIG